MIHTFLKAKHWQLFLVLCGPIFLFTFYTIIDVSSIFNEKSTTFDPNGRVFLKIFPLLMIFFISIFFGWFWSMGIGLQQCIPSTIKMKVTRFKIFFWTPLIYILCFMFMIEGSLFIISKDFEWIFALILPLHLFSMFCMFYMLYFVSKTIKTAELQKEVRFGEFSNEFFSLWFYFIGIWFIQPKVNKLYTKMNTSTNHLK